MKTQKELQQFVNNDCSGVVLVVFRGMHKKYAYYDYYCVDANTKVAHNITLDIARPAYPYNTSKESLALVAGVDGCIQAVESYINCKAILLA